MRVVFVERANGPERLVCDAELVFEEESGPLAGMKLVGFALWRSAEGEVFVSLPSRPFGAGGERRYFDLLRSVEGQSVDGRRVRSWILEQYKAPRPTAAA
jgi:hypothetical protein